MYFDVNKAKKVRSFYQDYNTLGPYSISASPIETDDPMDLVAAVLSEFGQSTAEQKAIFRPILEAWLLEPEDLEFLHSEAYLAGKKGEEVLQWVYEMF